MFKYIFLMTSQSMSFLTPQSVFFPRYPIFIVIVFHTLVKGVMFQPRRSFEMLHLKHLSLEK